jgi:hypothetical protein
VDSEIRAFGGDRPAFQMGHPTRPEDAEEAV